MYLSKQCRVWLSHLILFSFFLKQTLKQGGKSKTIYLGGAGSTSWGLGRRIWSREKVSKGVTMGGWVESWTSLEVSTETTQVSYTPASALSLLSVGGVGVFIHQFGQHIIWRLLPGGQTQKF